MKRIINNHNEKLKRLRLRRQQTPEEKILWEILRNNKLGCKWKRQVSINFYVADFYCREKMIAIELDGLHHNNNKEYDQERVNYFASIGITTLRFWNYEIHNNLTLVKNKIIAAIEAAPLSFKERGRG